MNTKFYINSERRYQNPQLNYEFILFNYFKSFKFLKQMGVCMLS